MAGPTVHDPYAALRVPSYRRLLSGGVLASIGSEIQATAVGIELYERTHDKLLLGLTGLAQFLPVLLLALPAGQLADRFNRKRIFQFAQSLSALSAFGLAVLSIQQGPIPLVFVLLVGSGIGRAFSAPARVSLLPQLIPTSILPNAVAWNSTGWQIANVSGPALGGLILGASGRFEVAYLLTGFCSMGCILLLIPVRPLINVSPQSGRSLAGLLDGVRFVLRSELLLAAITLDLFAVLLGGAIALLPVFARDILHVGYEELGLLRAAPAVGALVMALTLAHRPPLKRPGRALLLAVAGFGAATIIFGLSRNFYLSFLMLMLTGAFDNISVVVRGTLMQVLTPDEMRGRVAAVNTVFISSSNELGAFESGATAHYFGPIVSVVGGGIGTILIVLLVLFRWPRLSRLPPLHELRPEPPGK